MAESEHRTLVDKFMLRLPDGMRDRIRAAAEANGRSMNAEIVYTLEHAYPGNTEIDEIASAIAEKLDTFKREKSKKRRAEILEELSDLNQLLQKELRSLSGNFSTADDQDDIKFL